MHIVVLGGVLLYPQDRAKLEQLGTLTIYDQTSFNEDEIITRIADAHIIISEFAPITAHVLMHAPNLTMICLATTGFDAVDCDAARARNVIVTNIPTYATQSVAEHAIGLMLAAARSSFQAACDLRMGLFSPASYCGMELAGKTIGIIGYGRIGKAVGVIASRGFSMHLITYDIGFAPEIFDQLLRESDIISLHVPLNAQTKNMINESVIARMKDGVIIINTARGGIINETALIAALRLGKVRAAGLDVFTHEPPDCTSELFACPNVVTTPHIAFNTTDALIRRSHAIVTNIQAFCAQQPLNIVCR